MSIETHTITIEVEGTDITNDVVSWEINYPGIPSYVSDFRCNLVSDDYWLLCDPDTDYGTTRVVINIDSEVHQFLIEDRGETVGSANFDFYISGRSKQALLGKGFADTITDTENSGNDWQNSNPLASEIVAESLIVGNASGVTVNWSAYDYRLPAGVYSAKNVYPINVISRLSEVIGAVLGPQIDGSLNIETYSIDTPDPVHTSYSDTDDIVALSSGQPVGEGFDNVVIHGYTSIDEIAQIEQPNPVISITEQFKSDPLTSGGSSAIIVRLYHYHPDLDWEDIVNEVSTSTINVDVYESPPGNPIQGIEAITETVTYRFGEGRTSLPNTDGETVVTVGAPHDDKAVYNDSVTYNVYYVDMHITNLPPGNQAVVFYFADQTAIVEYGFTVIDSASTQASQTLILKDYYTDTLLSGVNVYCDSINPPTTLRGSTDGNGEITISNLDIGTTYYVIFTKTGYQDSDEDTLANDSFVAA